MNFTVEKVFKNFNNGKIKTEKEFAYARFAFFIKKTHKEYMECYFNSRLQTTIIDTKFTIDPINNIEKIWDIKKIYSSIKLDNFLNFSIYTDSFLNKNILIVQARNENRKLYMCNLENMDEIYFQLTCPDIFTMYKKEYNKELVGHGDYHFDSKNNYICFENNRLLYFRVNSNTGVRNCGCMISHNKSFNFQNFKLVEFINCKHSQCYELIPFIYNNQVYAIGFNYFDSGKYNNVIFDEEAIILFKMIKYDKFEQIKIIEKSEKTRYAFFIIGYDICSEKKSWMIMKNGLIHLYKIS